MGSTSLDLILAKTIYEQREVEIQQYLQERALLQAQARPSWGQPLAPVGRGMAWLWERLVHPARWSASRKLGQAPHA